MARKIDPTVEKIIKGYGLRAEDVLWDCHGTWCMYHRAIEQIAADQGITFDPPHVLEANGAAKSVALCVTGHREERTEWSVGEAAPGNCKNAYPYAMAEKRAKDRVVLKLIGLHGLVYSEDEMSEEAPKQQEPSVSEQPVVDESTTRFIDECKKKIASYRDGDQSIGGWWNSDQQKDARRAHGLDQMAVDALKQLVIAKLGRKAA